MDEKTVVFLCMGPILILIGCLLSANEKVAAWGLRHGKAKFWVKFLGEERAMKLTRYFLGPFTVVLGLIAIALGIIGE